MFRLSALTEPRRTLRTALVAAVALGAVSSHAGGLLYTEDFESVDAASGTALSDGGWTVFALVYEADGTTFAYDYGPFVAPNGSGGFSNVAVGEGGPDQGAQQIVTFSDYNNTDHNIGRVIETNVFQERTLTAADVGAPYRFTFDAKRGDLAGASTGRAFILTLDPGAGFALTNLVEIDLTAIPDTWSTYELELTLGAGLEGQLLQFGFGTRAANFEASGMVYDNLSFEPIMLESYQQDFEDLDSEDPDALGNDGWKVFGNVFDAVGNYLYGYGTFAAPNGSGGFSNVGVGEGGPDQGEQQIVIFNDYNNTDHNNGAVIESNVFQEQRVGLADVGETYTFSFDVKRGDLVTPTIASAFLKTLDPTAGFATTTNAVVNTEGLPATWQSFELDVTITPDLVGQILQFGFSSTTSAFAPSGMVYDNVTFGLPSDDLDGDGVADDTDNCLEIANGQQVDADGDGYGNACDADFNNDCIVNVVDLGILRTVFFTADAQADLNGDGVVNVVDLGILRTLFFAPPGPAGGPGVCDVN